MNLDHGLTPADFPTDSPVPISQEAIDHVVQTIRALAGWHIWPAITETMNLRTNGDTTVLLPTKKINELITVETNGQQREIPEGSWDESGILYLPQWATNQQTAKVTINHGWNQCPLMAVVQSMVTRSAKPQESITVGGVSIGAPGAVTPQSSEWRMLDLYKLGALP